MLSESEIDTLMDQVAPYVRRRVAELHPDAFREDVVRSCFYHLRHQALPRCRHSQRALSYACTCAENYLTGARPVQTGAACAPSDAWM